AEALRARTKGTVTVILGTGKDPKLIEDLRKASGAWLVEQHKSYAGSDVQKELHAILRRNGVIGAVSDPWDLATSSELLGEKLANGKPGTGLLAGSSVMA